VSLADALERAAGALPAQADAIRPANGDAHRLLESTDPAGAAAVLAWLLDKESAESHELLEVWLDEPAGQEAILALDEKALSKPGRKALRRARHQLKSRGVDVKEAPPEPVVARLPSLDDSLSGALVTAFDPRGGRMVYIAEQSPSGGARLFELALDDERGLLQVEVYSAGRSKVRGFLREIAGRGELMGCEVSPEAARALVARAEAVHPQDRPHPKGYGEWRSHLTGAPDGTALPGDEAAAALGEEHTPDRLAAAVALVRERRIGPWPPGGDLLERTAEKIRAGAESGLILAGGRRREQSDAALDEAIAEAYDEPGARLAAFRLREAAFVFWKNGDEDAARACLAAAAAFMDGAAENPVARAMFEVLFEGLIESLEQDAQTEEDAGSLIVKP